MSRDIHNYAPLHRCPQPAYVKLDGYAGQTKLFGKVCGETRRYYEFIPERDCYQFRAGKKRRVLKQHVRFQFTHPVNP